MHKKALEYNGKWNGMVGADTDLCTRNFHAWIAETNPPRSIVEEAARAILHLAVKFGHVIRAKTCAECGSDQDVHAHHNDYHQPYAVEYLCRQCHTKIPRFMQSIYERQIRWARQVSPMLSMGEAMKIATEMSGIKSPNTLRNMIRNGRLKAARLPGGKHYRIRKSDLLKALGVSE